MNLFFKVSDVSVHEKIHCVEIITLKCWTYPRRRNKYHCLSWRASFRMTEAPLLRTCQWKTVFLSRKEEQTLFKNITECYAAKIINQKLFFQLFLPVLELTPPCTGFLVCGLNMIGTVLSLLSAMSFSLKFAELSNIKNACLEFPN